jgi:hypothetical protein
MHDKRPTQRKDGTGEYYKIHQKEFGPLEEYLNGARTTEGVQRKLFN